MTRLSTADWQPVPYSGLKDRAPYNAMLLHTNGGGGNLFGWWKQIADRGERLGAQYQVMKTGQVICYVDPSKVVYHAYDASEWAFGVETEDNGDPNTPWTPQQIQSMANIGFFHGVPPVMLSGSAPSNGVGYHQLQHDWNKNDHNCPGSVRVAQIPLVLSAMSKLAGRPLPSKIPACPGVTREGMMNSPVTRAYQSRLKNRGWSIDVDGDHGPATTRVIKGFQSEKRLGSIDGVGGPETWAALWTQPVTN